MAEAQDPESPPVPGEQATVRIYEQLYGLISAGDVTAMVQHMEEYNITPQSFQALVEERYYHSVHYSPVATAARSGQLEVLRTLISLGFSQEEPSRNMTGKNEYPIHLACAANQTAIVRSLIYDYSVNVDTRDSGDTTPMFWAILTENMEMLQLLVEAGANVTNTFHTTITPLLFAAFNINPEMCQYLIEQGADVNEKEDRGNTPLCFALRDVNTSRVLIDAGADVNHVNDSGDSLLLRAIKRDYWRTVELLARRGADVDVRDSNGKTPLHYAIEYMHNDLASLLIIHFNADIDACDNTGITPFQVAFHSQNIPLVQLLLAAGVQPGREVTEHLEQSCDAPEWDVVVKKCQYLRPQSLEHLCHVMIRRLLGRELLSSSDKLPLPSIIKDDLTLKPFDKCADCVMSNKNA